MIARWKIECAAMLLCGAVLPFNAFGKATAKVLYNFTDAWPSSGLTEVGDTFYGTGGLGTFDRGAVFSITKDGVFSVIYSFGKFPDASIVNYAMLYKDGALYGVSEQGGNGDPGNNHFCKRHSAYIGCGTVFKVTPSGQEAILYAFSNKKKSDGFAPTGSLVAIGDKLYGMTAFGGSLGHGTIFSVTMAGKEKTIYGFSESDNGGAVLTAMNGVLYGATYGTGTPGSGALFSLTTTGVFTVLHNFGVGEGYFGTDVPSSMLPVNGVLYGTTPNGGTNNGGTIFTLTPDGTETVIASLDGAATLPYGNLVAKDSKLYSFAVGDTNLGATLFSVSAQDGSYKKVFRFGASNGGFTQPRDGLVLSGGSFYGTAVGGGRGIFGVVFEITP